MGNQKHATAKATVEAVIAAPQVTQKWWPLARLAWLIVATVQGGLQVVSAPYYFANLRDHCINVACLSAPEPPPGMPGLQSIGLSPTAYAIYGTLLALSVPLVYFAVAALIFVRAGQDHSAILAAFALLFIPDTIAYNLTTLADVASSWHVIIAATKACGLPIFLAFAYQFPDGHFHPQWTRWHILVMLLLLVLAYSFPGSAADFHQWPRPIAGAVIISWIAGIIIIPLYRYRQVANGSERQKMKWVVYGLTTALTGFFFFLPLPLFIAPEFDKQPNIAANLIVNTGASLALMLIPLCFGIAVLRYRLWDIDLIIQRTLVYGGLSVGIVGIYVLVVGYLGGLFRTSTNFPISLVATGVVAITLQPLRNWLQQGVNHLLYGERDEPIVLLTRLGQRLEAALTPDTILPVIVETVGRSLKVPYVALRVNDDSPALAEYGVPVPPAIVLPLVYQHEQIGQLQLAARVAGEAFAAADRRLLAQVAHQAAAALYTVQIAGALQRSREQLVLAREEERRRLRRDLHDGLGPRLATQTLRIDAARTLMQHDIVAADQLLIDLKHQTQSAIGDIRRLVYALRPPALDDLGLIAALQALGNEAETGGVSVSVNPPASLPMLPAATEVALYRITQEALTNVLRHAQATTCTLNLTVTDKLYLEIVDDGQGLPTAYHAGVGLHSMRERAAELGGVCSITTAPLGGTRVVAVIPLSPKADIVLKASER